ncbi:protein-L-isoaspartate(D-aspartate) O-methyltransferase [bacterium]|nr:protein-L-isoaspartate(D-aspartate) O-methyltransferase [bacterium]
MDPKDPRFRVARLVLSLRQTGISDLRVLEAIERTDRTAFVPESFSQSAWDDVELPIECGQVLTSPVMVAHMVQALGVQREHHVLEIGSGSGYQSVVLSRLARRVFTIDRWRTLIDDLDRRLDRLGASRIETRLADGLNGWETAAPFDRIILNGSVSEAPAALVRQLAPKGVLVAPVDDGERQSVTRCQLISDGKTECAVVLPSRFLPLTPGVAREL